MSHLPLEESPPWPRLAEQCILEGCGVGGIQLFKISDAEKEGGEDVLTGSCSARSSTLEPQLASPVLPISCSL
jgi:hypothetical protein